MVNECDGQMWKESRQKGTSWDEVWRELYRFRRKRVQWRERIYDG